MRVAFIDTRLKVDKLEINIPITEYDLIDYHQEEKYDSHSAICIKIFEENVKRVSECEVFIFAIMDDKNNGNVNSILFSIRYYYKLFI